MDAISPIWHSSSAAPSLAPGHPCRPPSFSPKQWERAKAILQAEPEISYSELARRTGMERRTLQRKVVRELGGRPEIPGPEASEQA